MYRRLLLVYVFSLSFLLGLSQTIEQAFGLRFPHFQSWEAYGFSRDSTQLTDDGFYPSRLKYNNWDEIAAIRGFREKSSTTCRLFSSTTVVLPAHAGKKECCTVTLNYKSEIEGLRFTVIPRDMEGNALDTYTVTLPAADRWTDLPFTFCKTEMQAVSIVISREGCDEAYQGRSIYLNKISIRLGNQELNDLPISSLVKGKNTRLNPKAIIPLSFENDASLDKIQDWKDKKIIALGESLGGIQDIREVQIQLMKHLITLENCRLILLELPQNQCFRWNLYLQGKLPDTYRDKLMKELKRKVYSPAVFFKFLQWVRQYNEKASDPVRIIGIDGNITFSESRCMAEYLLNFSTTRQDSVYYLKALKPNTKFYPDSMKAYILQSRLPEVLSKRDFEYLLFLIEEMGIIRTGNPQFFGIPESSFERAKKVERIIDIYLSSVEKAVIVAYSGRINKRFPIYDATVKTFNKTDSLGGYLYQRYGNQYHAVSIQIGERTCLADTSRTLLEPDSTQLAYYKKKGIRYPFIDSVKWKPPFLLSFEKAAMDSKIPYFYYPSNQLPEAIRGLNLFNNIWDDIPFSYCHIPSQFDALLFIREAKARFEYESNYYSGLDDRDDFLDIKKLLKELGE